MKKVNKWAQFLCQSKDLASSLRHFGEFKALQKWYYLNELQKIHDRTTNRHN